LNDAFLSYAKVDAEKVNALYQGLVAAGCLVWLDDVELRTSKPWRDQVRSGIDDARVLLVAFSGAWEPSRACKFELDYAVERQKPPAIVLVSGSTPLGEMPAALRDAAATWVSREESLERAVEITASWLLASRGPGRAAAPDR
jgi:hypothetical protein